LHPQDAGWWIAEYQLFDDPDFLDWIARQNMELIGFRPIRDLYREQSPPEPPVPHEAKLQGRHAQAALVAIFRRA
jgi:hypothetical protein